MEKNIQKLGIAAILAVVMLVVPNLVFAQGNLFLGQEHNYSIVLRGNGETIVYANLVINNTENSPRKDFSFEIPDANISELVVYQRWIPSQCINYDAYAQSKCVEYSYDGYYGNPYGIASYRKLDVTNSGSKYQVNFSEEILPNTHTSLVVSYAAKGYVTKKLGVFNFSFPIIKVSDRIQNVRVTVDVDSELYLKGKKSSVDYGSNMMADSAAMSMRSGEVAAPAMDQFVSRIGTSGALFKEAKSVAPGESFIVKGQYSTSAWLLNLNKIIIAILALIVLVVVVYFVRKFLHKRAVASSAQTGALDTQLGSGVLSLFHPLVLVLSFASVASIIGITYLFSKGNGSMLFNFYPSAMFGLLMMLMIMMLYFLLLAGPGIFMGIKHGWRGFLYVVIAQFLWFALFMLLMLLLFPDGMGTARYGGYGYPIY